MIDVYNKKFKEVAVLMGGSSSERDISMLSGTAIAGGLENAGYKVSRVIVAENNSFNLPDSTEAVFIALHGTFGEDGQVQEILENMRIPYTGSGIESSRLSFDKNLSRKAFESASIIVPCGVVYRKGDKLELPDFGVPLVVKPPRQGSSIGISVVNEEEDFVPALEDAFQYGDDVLIEDFIPGYEWTVPVVNGRVLPVIEICPEQSDGWFNWRAKYQSDGKTSYFFPEDDPSNKELTKSVRKIALEVFRAVKASGFARVDFRISIEDGKPYVLELNSIPGFTETSLLPKSAAKEGITFANLCAEIMESAKCG